MGVLSFLCHQLTIHTAGPALPIQPVLDNGTLFAHLFPPPFFQQALGTGPAFLESNLAILFKGFKI